MRINSIDYHGEDLSFEGLHLGQLNLFVSQNGVGKSRVLNKVYKILSCLMFQKPMQGNYDFEIQFTNHNEQLGTYNLEAKETKEQASYAETLILDNQIIFSRAMNEAVFMYNSISGEMDEHNIPFDKLAMAVVRDTKKYPIIEDLLNNIQAILFSPVGIITARNIYNKHLINSDRKAINIAEAFDNLSAEDKNEAKNALIHIGYQIADLNAIKIYNEYELHIREADLKNALQINQLSQGMLRAVWLVTSILHRILILKNCFFLIDDITEGLDYERAKKLGKWVFDTCQERGAQLIATTNDSFLMDIIDIEHWNILHREGDKVQCLNYQSHKEVFDEFVFTGLSNFDFFSSNFLDKHKVWEK